MILPKPGYYMIESNTRYGRRKSRPIADMVERPSLDPQRKSNGLNCVPHPCPRLAALSARFIGIQFHRRNST
jgi:hypothetical protein